MKIGLTGNIGSGKSTIAHFFKILQIPVFVADDVGKEILMNPALHSQLFSIFGSEIFDNQNVPDRKKIASIVFSNPKALQQLNHIIHSEVLKHFLQWTEFHANSPYVIMESAIIFEHQLEYLFDKIIMVKADEKTRIQRVIERDHCNENHVRARMLQQLSEEEKISKSDFIINNNYLQPLTPQILSLHQSLLKR